MTKKELADRLKKVCYIAVIVGCIFLFIALFKLLAYNNPEYYGRTINAYVGGDGYNFIINGTYFAGFSVLSIGAYIIAAISGITSSLLSLHNALNETEDNK